MLRPLLRLAAVLEGLTGLVLIIAPALVAQLLLGQSLVAAGLSVGRVAGIALVALAFACWPPGEVAGEVKRQPVAALRGMLTYNALVTCYLFGLGVTSQSVGWLLWPGVALHGVFTILFVRSLFRASGPSKLPAGIKP